MAFLAKRVFHQHKTASGFLTSFLANTNKKSTFLALKGLGTLSSSPRISQLPGACSSSFSFSTFSPSFSNSNLQKTCHDEEGFDWGKYARESLSWQHPFHTTSLIDTKKGLVAYYLGGKINASENCIDRHLATRGNQTALIWESDHPADSKRITYAELSAEVCRLANALKAQGVKKGDRVCIYMPMTPHAVYAVLACARIGAPHSIVFAGFSAESLRSRIQDAGCSIVITSDQAVRGGKLINLKHTVDEALVDCPHVKAVFVSKRTGNKVSHTSRDIDLEAAMSKERPWCPPEHVDAEDPLFILYTSGSTGKPKGLLHSTGGYLSYAQLTHKTLFDYREGDIYACVADIGWITGHSYVVYGPLLNGATTVLFESLPTYPDAGRYWEMVERLRINQFYTAPTAIRMLMKSGESFVKKYDRSSLRILGSVGEPINPEAWRWFHEVVGEKRCPIMDTWWQTETGGVMISPRPDTQNPKPGAAMLPFHGVQPVLVDAQGKEIHGNDVTGNLCLKSVTPGMARTIFGDHEKYLATYWKVYPGYYFTGDGARRDEDGHYWITGRVDDVINVSGHRIGTAEVESSLVGHHGVAEAAVVGFPHEIKGTGIYCFVILKDGVSPNHAFIHSLENAVRQEIGPFAKPDIIHIVPGLPKTRSGKIMRRILRKIAANEVSELGDTSTLNDPAIVDILVQSHQALMAAKQHQK